MWKQLFVIGVFSVRNYSMVQGFRKTCVPILRKFSTQANSIGFQCAEKEGWIVKNVFQDCISVLEENNVPEPFESSMYIISKAASIPYRRSEFMKKQTQKLSYDEVESIRADMSRRLKREPIQYILGDWDFYGLKLFCKSPILIPRPETEELVDNIINSKVLNEIITPRILDVGSGTGAIGLALISKLSNANCTAIDLNPMAVELSHTNARVLGLSERYECILADMKEFLVDETNARKFDLVVSNPPYIPIDEMKDLEPEISDYEDPQALYGGVDGLQLIEILIQHCGQILSCHGSRQLWLEVASIHPSIILKRFQDKEYDRFGVSHVETRMDIFENPRFVCVHYSP